MKKNYPDTDVVIAGAGIVGTTLAILLAKNNISCVLVDEQNNFYPGKLSSDPRALAITPASENILRSIDAWQHIAMKDIGIFREMYVWDANGNGNIHFDSADLCEARLGSIVKQANLEQVLHNTASELDNIVIIHGAPVSFITHEDKVSLVLTDKQQITAQLLVGADGSRSCIRSLANIAFPQHDYRQHAVACIATTEKPHNEVARQCFLDNGPLAFLPLADPVQCGIVWSTSQDAAQRLLAMTEPDFNLELGSAFAHNAGRIIASSPRASFKLLHAQADAYCQSRLVLVGDAAHVVHPLAGQGANLGLLDAASLADILMTAHSKNRDLGRMSVLRRYERWRKSENMIMLKIFQGLNYLFENQMDLVKTTRNIGMDLVDAITPVKFSIMRYAMGLAGDLPVIARRTG